jgi:hypothetical protein
MIELWADVIALVVALGVIAVVAAVSSRWLR